MVERLKEAIEKARLMRADQTGRVVAPRPAPRRADWSDLREAKPSPESLIRYRIVSANKINPVYAAFDLLRTRIIKICADKKVRRIAVTSPTKGCGKSLVTLNLAYSLARQRELSTLVFDLDLRDPSFVRMLGFSAQKGASELLSGDATLDDVCLRLAPSLAVVPNYQRIRDSAELLISSEATAAIGNAIDRLQPDFVLFDLPPLFGCDDALAFMSQVDAVILVAGGGQTTAKQIEDSEQLLAAGPDVLGIVLNKAEDIAESGYRLSYDDGAAA